MTFEVSTLAKPSSAVALQGAYLRSLVRGSWGALTGFAAVGLGLAFGIAAGPIWGALAAVATALCGLTLLYLIARRRAHRDFFAAYARDRGLELVEEGLPEVTPLLYAGSSRRTELAMEGELAAGLHGTIAHYTYAEHVGAGGGSSGSSTTFEMTVVLIEVPETATAFPRILCHGRIGSQQTDKLDDALSGRNRKRLRLESEAFNRRFEVFYDPAQDEVRLRRLFAPAFIVWLTESMPSAFELVNGHLCCFASGHLSTAAELDTLVAGGVHLSQYLREEVAE